MGYKQLGLFDAPVESIEKKPIFCCLDFETGSLDEKTGGLCSVAIIQLDEDLNEYDRFYFVLYEPGKKYEPEALQKNGFTVEQLEREGLRPETFISLLHQLIDGYIMVNHNSQFDVRWLNFRGWNIQESICTMENDYAISPYAKHKLGIVYNRYYGHDFQDAHNAEADTAATCDLLRWQVKKDPKYGQPKPINWTRFK